MSDHRIVEAITDAFMGDLTPDGRYRLVPVGGDS